MKKRFHYLQHVPFEGLGSMETWAVGAGYEMTATRHFANDPLPAADDFDWLVVMGGPMGVDDEDKYPWLVEEKRFIEAAVGSGKVVIGICLGAQLIADVMAAKVYRNSHKEIGWFPVQRTDQASDSNLFAGFPERLDVFHWHGDTFDLPAGAIHVARSEACENQAFVYDDRVVGLQFHLETTRLSVERLIENCASELLEAPFIQTADGMLEDDRRFEAINRVMADLLNRLEPTAPPPAATE